MTFIGIYLIRGKRKTNTPAQVEVRAVENSPDEPLNKKQAARDMRRDYGDKILILTEPEAIELIDTINELLRIPDKKDVPLVCAG